jgi:hypothetical protein
MVPRWRIAVVVALGLAGPTLTGAAQAQQLEDFKAQDTGALARLCGTAESSPLYAEARQYCYGFISGAGAMYRVAAAAGDMRRIACPKSEPTVEQIRQMFVGWAGQHPEAASEAAIDGLFRAAAATWPCPS